MAWGLRRGRSKPAEPESINLDPSTPPPSAPPPPRVTAPGVTLHTLRQALIDLYGQRVPRDDFAVAALDLIAKALNATAGALLAYDPRRDRLQLVAATGLAEPARQVLGGEQGAPGWDIPMRGLANRRINVIEAAHQNPFVPRALIDISQRRLTIATLPFFHGYAPAGVLVLFSANPHGFGDTQLQAAAQSLKVCGVAFAELPRATIAPAAVGEAPANAPSASQTPAGAPAVLDRQRAADAQEIARLRTAFDEALWQHAKELAETRREAARSLDDERARLSAFDTKLAEAEAERDRFASQLAATRGELATLADARVTLETHRAEVQRLREALTSTSATLDLTNARLAELQRAHAELVEQHDAALRQHAEATTTGATAHQRDAATITALRERLANVEADQIALRSAHQQTLGQLSARETRLTELETQLAERIGAVQTLETQHAQLRTTHDDTLQRLATVEQTAARLQQQLAEHTTALGHERESLQQQLARAASESTDLSRTLAATRAETERAVTERNHAISVRDQQITTLQAQLTEAVARYDSDVGERSSHVHRLAEERDAAKTALRHVEATLASRTERAQQLEHERASLNAALETERTAAATSRTDNETQIDTMRGELAATQQHLATQGDELQRLAREWETERTTLRARSQELEAELQRTLSERIALAEALAADESEPTFEIERHVMPGADAADDVAADDSLATLAADLPADEGAANLIAVIDGDFRAPIAAAIQRAGWNTMECEPTDSVVDQLAAQRLSGIAINVMASSHGWQLVRALRERGATRAVPLLLYAKAAEASGFSFGAADCVLWPNEPQRLLDALARLAPGARRVLAMSSDIDVVATVREQLTGAGLSAAVMLDGKQALDLLPSVRPDAVVLHLSPSCVDVFRTIAGLRAETVNPALPIVLLMDQTPSSRDESFLNGGTRTLANKGTFGASRVADALARLMIERVKVDAPDARAEEPVEPRRERAVGVQEGWLV